LKIKLHTPLDRILGPVKEVPLTQPLSVADLLACLKEKEPDFAPFAGFGPKDVHPYGLLVWRGNKLLTLADTLDPTDEVEMILMAAGG